jgi:hypothetical protein
MWSSKKLMPLPSPATKNDVKVDVAKKTQVEKAAKTTPSTNTEALKIVTTNKFKNQVAKIGANHQPL